MDNGMENLLDTYLFETNSLLEQLDELLINAEKNGDFTQDDVNEIFRSMHTIKGSSAMLEFNSLMTIAHHIEDLFYYIRENGTETLSSENKSELFNLMFQSTDKLREEVHKVENSEPLTENIGAIAEEINSFLAKISTAGEGGKNTAEEAPAVPAPVSQTVAALPADNAPYFIHVFFDEGIGMENLRAFMLVNALQDNDLNPRFYPSDVESNPETAEKIIRGGFFIAADSKELLDREVNVVKVSNNIHTYEVLENAQANKEEAKAGESESEKKDAGQAPAAQKKNAAPTAVSNKQSLISVNLSKLDSLMAIVGEIVITESMVISSPELKNVKLDSFLKSTRQLRKLTDDLQDIAMSLRMVPVSGVFQKMNRIVRDMKKDLNKDARLTLIGEDTEVDKSIVDSISDPIMHLVRNCMDHGLEANVQDRINAGKDPQGEIVLSAEHTGSEVIISVSDDGQGMDPEVVLAKAKANGLLTKPDEEYSKKEILSMLMLPGFSTNKEVTEYSGRGVGMDVVKKNVEALGGTVIITSDKGKGSRVTMKLPLTLAIVDGMEIAVGENIFTVPLSNIRQSFKATSEEVIYDAEGHEMIKCMDEFYPIVRLHDLYQLETQITKIEDGILMWLEANDKSFCIFVDQLIGEQQVVVKPLPTYLNHFNIKEAGISGCTILGDGNISIILDVANIHQTSL